jgi:hypothetical protein
LNERTDFKVSVETAGFLDMQVAINDPELGRANFLTQGEKT